MLSINQIAQAVGGDVSAGRVLAPAPGHSPADRGMCIKISDDAPDGFVVHCFNGGDDLAAKDYVREKLGLGLWQPKRGKPGNGSAGQPINMAPKRTKHVADYDYRDASGALIYQVQRYDTDDPARPKTFLQRRPNGHGGWIYKLDDIVRVPYRLADLAKFPDATIFVTEGEKDADAVAALGLCATTVASHVWTASCTAPLAGRDVIIFEDNDAAGRQHSLAAAKALHGIAKSIRIVSFQDLPKGGDVSDWLAQGHGREDLAERGLAAPLWQPDAELPPVAGVPEPLGEWDAGDDDQPIPPRAWLLGNAFCRGFISSVIAEGGTGKTALRLAQLLSLASGRALTGEHVFLRCRVLIVSLEDNAHELRRRVRAACLEHGVKQSELRGWLYLASLRASDGKLMVLDAHGRPVPGALAAKLAVTIESRKIDIVSIDPFIKSHSLEENSNSAIDEVVQLLANMADQFDIAVDVPHHAAKGQPDPGNANRGRGASAMKDAARLVYTLTPMSPEEAQALGLGEIDRRWLIRLDSAKVNITPPMAEAKWFRLVGVDIGNGIDLYPNGDQVQTVVPWTPPDTFAGLGTALINSILDDIEAGVSDGVRYSDGPNATTSAAWRVIVKHYPSKSEATARQIIKLWVKSGLLIHRIYDNKLARKSATGLWVDPEKRPS
ncbi:hypothetical protein ACVIQT_008018 [Bradyrhizobium diazoefficiens]